MPERDNDAPRTSEQARHELLTFVQEAEFGTAQYMAINDIFDLHDVGDLLQVARQSDESDRLKLEIEYALVEERIKLGKSRIEGYSRAHEYFGKLGDDLGETLASEAEKKYKRIGERESYWESVHDPIMDEAREIILSKRG